MQKRLIRLPDHAPLSYAPDNEQGVVYMFSRYAKEHGLRVESIQSGFPDCMAYRDGKRVRIEFEYRSRNFFSHGHDPKKCDMLVCWIHDWPAVPANLEVVELRSEYGLSYNVWIQAVAGKQSELLMETDGQVGWSVASQASPGDLILFYHARPHSYLSDIFTVVEPVSRSSNAAWKKGTKFKTKGDYFAEITRVTQMKTPLHLEELRAHRILGMSPIIRKSMLGRSRATPYWKALFDMILSRNPGLKRKLLPFGPQRLVS